MELLLNVHNTREILTYLTEKNPEETEKNESLFFKIATLTFKSPLLPAGDTCKTFFTKIPVTVDPLQDRSTFPPTMDIPNDPFSSRLTYKK